MLEIMGIIERHIEQLEEEIKDAIVSYEVSEKKFGNFEDVLTYSISQDNKLEIGEKEYNYTLFVSILSGEDQRTEQVKAALKEIEKNQDIKFH